MIISFDFLYFSSISSNLQVLLGQKLAIYHDVRHQICIYAIILLISLSLRVWRGRAPFHAPKADLRSQ
jgi:hypothetical protein